MNAKSIIRRARFAPYVPGQGPRFDLTTWDTGRTGFGGKYLLGYRLRIIRPGTILILFEGEDFGCSPMHAIDSDETLAALMGFLTLRPGDTDADYFANYTPEQMEFAQQHAEALACEVESRFGQG